MRNHSHGSGDVAIAGGGLAGLTAAVLLARCGRNVLLFEKSPKMGGRAVSDRKDGITFNLGAHALYRKGAAMEILRDLGVALSGRKPGLHAALTPMRSGHSLFRGISLKSCPPPC